MFTTGAAGRVIPSGFVGLSTEMWAIPLVRRQGSRTRSNPAFVQLVRNLAPGRPAGDPARRRQHRLDLVAGARTRKTPPGIRYTLTPEWVQITKAFVNAPTPA